MKMPCRVSKGLGKSIIYLKLTETIDKEEMVEEMDTLSGVDLKDESIEDLFNEAHSSMEEAKKIADKLYGASVSPLIPHR